MYLHNNNKLTFNIFFVVNALNERLETINEWINVYYRKKLEKIAEYYLQYNENSIKKDANACKNST